MLDGSTWTDRDRLLVEYYWLKGRDTSFIASTVDRTPNAVEIMIRRIRKGEKPARRRIVLQPRIRPERLVAA